MPRTLVPRRCTSTTTTRQRSPAMTRSATIENAPANGQLYGIPNDIRYAFSDIERERINAQSTVQFAPIDGLTLTPIHVRQEQASPKIAASRPSGCSAMASTTSCSTPATRSPRRCCCTSSRAPSKDFGYEQQHREQKNDLNSIGLQRELGCQPSSFNLRRRLSRFARRQHAERRRSPAAAKRCSASRARCRAPAIATRRRPDGVARNFWTQTFQFNKRPADCRAHVVPDQPGRVRRTPAETPTTTSTRQASVRRFCASTIKTRTPTSSRRVSTASSSSKAERTLGFGVETRAMEMHAAVLRLRT